MKKVFLLFSIIAMLFLVTGCNKKIEVIEKEKLDQVSHYVTEEKNEDGIDAISLTDYIKDKESVANVFLARQDLIINQILEAKKQAETFELEYVSENNITNNILTLNQTYGFTVDGTYREETNIANFRVDTNEIATYYKQKEEIEKQTEKENKNKNKNKNKNEDKNEKVKEDVKLELSMSEISNEDVINELHGDLYKASRQILSVFKEEKSIYNEKDLDLEILCSDNHFDIFENKYIFKIMDKIEDIKIGVAEGKVYFEYRPKEIYSILNIHKKGTNKDSYKREYIRKIKENPNDEKKKKLKFKIDDSYLNRIYNFTDEYLVASEYKPLDFIKEESVNLNDFCLDDECICINSEYLKQRRLVRVKFKGLLKDTVKEFITKQENTLRDIFTNLMDAESVERFKYDPSHLLSSAIGPDDTLIITDIKDNVFSVLTRNLVNYPVGDTIEYNNLLVDLKTGKKMNNTKMLEMLSVDKDSVISQIADNFIEMTIMTKTKDEVEEAIGKIFDEGIVLYLDESEIKAIYVPVDLEMKLQIAAPKSGPFAQAIVNIETK